MDIVGLAVSAYSLYDRFRYDEKMKLTRKLAEHFYRDALRKMTSRQREETADLIQRFVLSQYEDRHD